MSERRFDMQMSLEIRRNSCQFRHSPRPLGSSVNSDLIFMSHYLDVRRLNDLVQCSFEVGLRTDFQ